VIRVHSFLKVLTPIRKKNNEVIPIAKNRFNFHTPIPENKLEISTGVFVFCVVK